MSKQKRQKRSTSQVILWLLSMVLVASMILSLVIIALPAPPQPTPTPIPWPTFPQSTVEPTASPTEPLSTVTPSPSPTVPPTEPVLGPELPTATALPTVAPPPMPEPTATPAAAIPELIFAVAGDSYNNPKVYPKLLQTVMTDGSEFLIQVGDLVTEGAEAKWQAFQEGMSGFPLPFYPVPGNHDGLQADLTNYLAYSGAPAVHFSFDRGPVHLTLADSHNGGIAAAELAWLRDDLNGTAQPLKMVFLHHPPFDPDGTDHIMAYGNDSFMELMAAQGVDYVFAGHIHAYAQGERDGVVYTVTGGAGAPLYHTGHSQAFYHYLRVTVQGEQVAIEVIKV